MCGSTGCRTASWIPLAIATYTALPVSLLFAGRPADIWRVIGAGLVVVLLPASAYPVFKGANCAVKLGRHSGRCARVLRPGEPGLGVAALVVVCVFGSGAVHGRAVASALPSARLCFALVALAARRILCGRFRSRGDRPAMAGLFCVRLAAVCSAP